MDLRGELGFAWCAVHATRPGVAPAAALRLLQESPEFAGATLISGITYTSPIFGRQGVLGGRRGRRA